MFKFDIGSGNTLRIFEKQHSQALFELTDSCRDYLKIWLPWVERTLTVKDTESFIDFTRQQFANNKGFQAGIWCGDEIAGCIGFHSIDWSNQSTSIGYWLGEKYQGHGLMTQACRAFINHAFYEYKLNRVEISCALENTKSRAIPERLGFKQEGIRRELEKLSNGKLVDHALYGLLASEWK